MNDLDVIAIDALGEVVLLAVMAVLHSRSTATLALRFFITAPH